MNLRPYQQKIIDEARAEMKRGCKSILICAPTGSGKTLLTAHMLHTAASRGMRAWFVVHRRELIKQSIEAFNREGLKHGVISAGFCEDSNQRVQIASVQSLARRILRLHKPSVIVWDESHHLAAGSWSRIYGHFQGVYHIGLTATPVRLDGRGLAPFFRQIICGPSVSWLIDHGYLSKFKIYAPSTIATAGIRTWAGDYAKHDLIAAADRPVITGSALAHYRRLAANKRAIMFCVSIQHSQHVVAQFQAAGIPAQHIDGETPTEVRDHAIKQFESGLVRVLSNVELFGEGYDCPQAEVAILLRPTQSTGLYLQQVGRVLRPSDGKAQAIILDHAGNTLRHGMPDEERTWSLAGLDQSNRGNSETAVSVRVCRSCLAAQRAGSVACTFCGFIFPIEPRVVPEKEGELEEVTALKREARQEQGYAKDLASLTELGRKRRYRNPAAWAFFIVRAREAKRRREQAQRIHG